jgi:hypothetical protein
MHIERGVMHPRLIPGYLPAPGVYNTRARKPLPGVRFTCARALGEGRAGPKGTMLTHKGDRTHACIARRTVALLQY